MARTSIDISSECLADILGHFDLLGIKVLGSAASNELGCVRLCIEGEWLPDADLVTCEVRRVAVNHVMQITATVHPVSQESEASPRASVGQSGAS